MAEDPAPEEANQASAYCTSTVGLELHLLESLVLLSLIYPVVSAKSPLLKRNLSINYPSVFREPFDDHIVKKH